MRKHLLSLVKNHKLWSFELFSGGDECCGARVPLAVSPPLFAAAAAAARALRRPLAHIHTRSLARGNKFKWGANFLTFHKFYISTRGRSPAVPEIKTLPDPRESTAAPKNLFVKNRWRTRTRSDSGRPDLHVCVHLRRRLGDAPASDVTQRN